MSLELLDKLIPYAVRATGACPVVCVWPPHGRRPVAWAPIVALLLQMAPQEGAE